MVLHIESLSPRVVRQKDIENPKKGLKGRYVSPFKQPALEIADRLKQLSPNEVLIVPVPRNTTPTERQAWLLGTTFFINRVAPKGESVKINPLRIRVNPESSYIEYVVKYSPKRTKSKK